MADDGESTVAGTSNAAFNDLLNAENVKRISTNPFLENEVSNASVSASTVFWSVRAIT